MAYKGHAANKKETTQIKKKPRKQNKTKQKENTHTKRNRANKKLKPK